MNALLGRNNVEAFIPYSRREDEAGQEVSATNNNNVVISDDDDDDDDSFFSINSIDTTELRNRFYPDQNCNNVPNTIENDNGEIFLTSPADNNYTISDRQIHSYTQLQSNNNSLVPVQLFNHGANTTSHSTSTPSSVHPETTRSAVSDRHQITNSVQISSPNIVSPDVDNNNHPSRNDIRSISSTHHNRQQQQQEEDLQQNVVTPDRMESSRAASLNNDNEIIVQILGGENHLYETGTLIRLTRNMAYVRLYNHPDQIEVVDRNNVRITRQRSVPDASVHHHHRHHVPSSSTPMDRNGRHVPSQTTNTDTNVSSSESIPPNTGTSQNHHVQIVGTTGIMSVNGLSNLSNITDITTPDDDDNAMSLRSNNRTHYNDTTANHLNTGLEQITSNQSRNISQSSLNEEEQNETILEIIGGKYMSYRTGTLVSWTPKMVKIKLHNHPENKEVCISQKSVRHQQSPSNNNSSSNSAVAPPSTIHSNGRISQTSSHTVPNVISSQSIPQNITTETLDTTNSNFNVTSGNSAVGGGGTFLPRHSTERTSNAVPEVTSSRHSNRSQTISTRSAGMIHVVSNPATSQPTSSSTSQNGRNETIVEIIGGTYKKYKTGTLVRYTAKMAFIIPHNHPENKEVRVSQSSIREVSRNLQNNEASVSSHNRNHVSVQSMMSSERPLQAQTSRPYTESINPTFSVCSQNEHGHSIPIVHDIDNMSYVSAQQSINRSVDHSHGDINLPIPTTSQTPSGNFVAVVEQDSDNASQDDNDDDDDDASFFSTESTSTSVISHNDGTSYSASATRNNSVTHIRTVSDTTNLAAAANVPVHVTSRSLLVRENITEDTTSSRSWRCPGSDNGFSLSFLGLREVSRTLVPMEAKTSTDATFAFCLFGSRLGTFQIREDVERIPVVFEDPRDNYVYELLCTKLHAENRKQAQFGKQARISAQYVVTKAPGLPSIDLKSILNQIADFGQLECQKVSSRLELLMTTARKSNRKGRDFLIFDDLSSFDIEVIPELCNEGCGFIPRSYIEKFLGSSAVGKRTFGVQVRIFSTTHGIFKGILVEKPGIQKIQLPCSMLKVPPLSNTNVDKVCLLITGNGQFPSSTNINISKFLEGKFLEEGKNPSRSWYFKKLSKMILAVMKLHGVPDNVLSEYQDKSYGHGMKGNDVHHAYIVGAADPTNAIPPGYVFVTGILGTSIATNNDRLFVTRCPCTEASDAHMLPIVRSKPSGMSDSDWQYFINLPFGGIIFGNSTPRLPWIVGQGDLDGDLYFICWNEVILGHMDYNTFDNVPLNYATVSNADDSTTMQNAVDRDWFKKAQEHMGDLKYINNLHKIIGKLYKLMEDANIKGKYNDATSFGRAYKQALDLAKHGGKVTLPIHLWDQVPIQFHEFFIDT